MLKQTEQKKRKTGKALLSAGLVTLSYFTLQALRGVMASTATLPIQVRLVKAIELTLSNSMDFGTLAVTDDRAGYARLDTNLNALVVDNNSSLSLAGGTPQIGRFRIKGAAYPMTISIEESSVQLTNGVETLTVNDFNLMTANGGLRATLTPAAGSGSFTIPVGASINTKAGQQSGTYVGATRIFANFQ